MMFEKVKHSLIHFSKMFLLWGYGWKPKKTIYFGKPSVQWRDPLSFVWVSEKAAMKLLTVQVMDEYNRR